MYTCISSHRLKRSWRSCPRPVNAGNKNTPSTHHPRRRNVTTLMVGLKNGHIRKNLTQKWWTPEILLGNTKKKQKTNKKTVVSETKNFGVKIEVSNSKWTGFRMLPQPVGLLKLMLNFVCTSSVQGKELCWCDCMKCMLSIVMWQ